MLDNRPRMIEQSKLPKIGLVVEGPDRFIKPIEASLAKHYRLDRFTPRFVKFPLISTRVNEIYIKRQIIDFVRKHDLTFFEWGGPLSILASQNRDDSKIALRMHRIDYYVNRYNFTWPGINKVILVSNFLQNDFWRLFPNEKDRTTVIPNGVNVSLFSPKPKIFEWKIGILGDLRPRKRVYDLICMLIDLPDSIPWRLFVGGEPIEPEFSDYWQALHQLVDHLHLQQKVFFLGKVERPWEWLRSLDIFISASYSEGHQVSLLEAMASGLYCLSHYWGGVEETLPPENIFVTGAELRQKLLKYADLQKQERADKRHRLRKIVESKFDERQMIYRITSTIDNLL